ncbi:MAG: helix-turn-helix transcriptional regulator [Deltaproteobacteria bacterium]|nr:helix-turn-helix transcriptional regulator [Deltaproteobacteria bacterium]
MAKRKVKRKDNSLRKRIGAFVRERRTELGLSQGEIIKAMGYVSRNSVSNIEVGREGLPAKRIYAWADILEVPRDQFFRFATGEIEQMEVAGAKEARGNPLSAAEKDLLGTYRSLPPKYQRRLREQAQEYITLAQAGAGAKRS